jgi:hypothetical protein
MNIAVPDEIQKQFSDLKAIYDSFKLGQTQYMHDHTYNIVDDNDKNDITKILTTESITKALVTYDFLNSVPTTQYDTIDGLINETHKILEKYQYKVGGYHIEDNKWFVQTDETANNRIKIKSNQTFLVNSISESNAYDTEFKWFMNELITHIKKYNANPEIRIRHKVIDDYTFDIYWIVIIFETKKDA